jgi:hypothetical protein
MESDPMKLSRIAAACVMAGAVIVAVPGGAGAAPPDPSAITVSATTVQPGGTFTVTQEVHNPNGFAIAGARPTLLGLADVADIVSCDGSVYSCNVYLDSFRSYLGDLAAGATRTVTWTLKVRDTAAPGTVQLRHQLDGEDYAFAPVNGPVLTIAQPKADIAVSMNASPRAVRTSRIVYELTVRNLGPADASAIRLTAVHGPGLIWAGSQDDCTRVAGTRTVVCDIDSLASGASTTVTFAARAGLLAIGPLTATVQRTQSTPADPNAANDRASKTCSALTGLLVRC